MGVRLSLLGISALLRLATVVTEAPRSTGSDIRDTTKWTVVEFDKRNVSLPCAVDTSGLPLLHVGWYMCRIQMIQECRSGSEKRKIAHIENMSNVSIVRPDEFDLTLNGSLIILRILSKYNKMIFLCKGKVRFHRHHENFTILHLVFPSTSRPSLRPTTPDIPIATGPSSSGIPGFARSPPPVLGGSKEEVDFATAFHKVLPLNIFLFVLLAIAVVIIILLVIKIQRHGEDNLNDAPDHGIPMQPSTNDAFNPPNRGSIEILAQ
ncbi:uncharacterized protein LOC111327198 [Stylophora pistillata]|uniref:uncharacterized protein LOC111327198 n=1 Tax=Stylophora pistillata TaxID=50429 RepID=UPI000C0451CB|nr:uncharacterized protein LOC111327198 [Stylophora pistillata]